MYAAVQQSWTVHPDGLGATLARWAAYVFVTTVRLSHMTCPVSFMRQSLKVGTLLAIVQCLRKLEQYLISCLISSFMI